MQKVTCTFLSGYREKGETRKEKGPALRYLCLPGIYFYLSKLNVFEK